MESINNTSQAAKKIRILFVDNDIDFLKARKELLERAGYEVAIANNLADAERYLRERWAPVAILDIRLENDEDEKDITGLALVTHECARTLGRIILTNFADAVENLIINILHKEEGDAENKKILLLDKSAGLSPLVRHIENLVQSTHSNWDLGIECKLYDAPWIVNRIQAGLDSESLQSRVEEFEQLLGRLFFEKDCIRIDHPLWSSHGRVALAVIAFKKNMPMQSYVVICGSNAQVLEERHRFQECAPRALGDRGTILCGTAETTHFAANAYMLIGADLERLNPLADMYQVEGKSVGPVLRTLVEKTLFDWHQGHRAIDGRTLEESYRERLRLSTQYTSEEAFEERLTTIMGQAPRLNARIERKDEMLNFLFDGQRICCPDPVNIIFHVNSIGQPNATLNAPGILTASNILADATGAAWLTDFAGAGQAPQLWNLVSLEAIIRFDCLGEQKPVQLSELENCLLDNRTFGKLDTVSLEKRCRAAVNAIRPIRQSAARLAGMDHWSYHLGILFVAAQRFMNPSTVNPLTDGEVARQWHLLLAMALIAAKFSSAKRDIPVMEKEETGIRKDDTRGVFLHDGAPLQLEGQGLAILSYLYDHAGKLCTRREIIENCVRETYGKRDEYQASRLNTAIRRLRVKIEDNADTHQHLITEHGRGYTLMPKP